MNSPSYPLSPDCAASGGGGEEPRREWNGKWTEEDENPPRATWGIRSRPDGQPPQSGGCCQMTETSRRDPGAGITRNLQVVAEAARAEAREAATARMMNPLWHLRRPPVRVDHVGYPTALTDPRACRTRCDGGVTSPQSLLQLAPRGSRNLGPGFEEFFLHLFEKTVARHSTKTLNCAPEEQPVCPISRACMWTLAGYTSCWPALGCPQGPKKERKKWSSARVAQL